MKANLLLFTLFLIPVSFAQTTADKIAAAYCECEQELPVFTFVKLFREGDQKVIRENYEKITLFRNDLKTCAQAKLTSLTPEERDASKKEIMEALKKTCPETHYFLEQYKKMMSERMAEMKE